MESNNEQTYFNPRPPCGGRLIRRTQNNEIRNFNPRPPCGGRLCQPAMSAGPILHFNPRPPCGERRTCGIGLIPAHHISIHAPRAGSDKMIVLNWSITLKFQSTPPVRGATSNSSLSACLRPISIHAPRAGGDFGFNEPRVKSRNFNPRPPCGGRHKERSYRSGEFYFNPRPPCGGRLFN